MRMEAYGVSLAEGVDVEEGERLVCFQELEAGDLAWRVGRGLAGNRSGESFGGARGAWIASLALDNLAKDAGGHFARHWVVSTQVTEMCTRKVNWGGAI